MQTNMTQSTQKKAQIGYTNDNILEQLREVSADVPKTALDVAGKIGTDVITSIFGGTTQMSGELRPNEAIQLGEMSPVASTGEKAPQIHARVDLQPRPSAQIIESQTRQQIEAIRQELKAIAASLKGLRQEVATAVESAPVDPGIYHINFYEQLRSFLHVLRVQIEDSRSWLHASNSKKKKMGYWGMYKKHGTTFGLSNERSLATSAG